MFVFLMCLLNSFYPHSTDGSKTRDRYGIISTIRATELVEGKITGRNSSASLCFVISRILCPLRLPQNTQGVLLFTTGNHYRHRGAVCRSNCCRSSVAVVFADWIAVW
uniref:Putative secreted protein n=1 Tax=Anopheles darlingi TaxID=43151 RepID=A0A2M4DRP4_ANODA